MKINLIKKSTLIFICIAIIFSVCSCKEADASREDVLKHGGVYNGNGKSFTWETLISKKLVSVRNNILESVDPELTGEFHISDKITSIEQSSFRECKIETVVIPESVTKINRFAFNNCSNLKSIYIPKSVTFIGLGAFNDCSSLENVHITDLESWCNIDFADPFANPIKYSCKLLLDNSELTDISIPDGVKTIKQYAFCNNKSLKTLTIPSSVTTIEMFAFCDCAELENIVIPESVTQIGKAAFANCKKLKSVTIPKSVTIIKENTFYGCAKITDVYYTGTEKDWETIKCETNNDILNEINVKFNYAEDENKDKFNERIY